MKRDSKRKRPHLLDDPYLAPYAEAVRGRAAHARARAAELVAGGTSLADWASAHEYFGLHRTKRGWTFREWAPNATEMWLVGDFTPKGLGETVRVRAKSLHCFTGSPDLLSENQRKCLRMYYQLHGEAEKRKEEVLRDAAARSPYAADAAAAVAEFRDKAKEVEAAADSDGEAKRKATYELSQLRTKVQELNEKHKTWKSQHAAELPDPAKDSKYLKFLEDARQYAEPIAGMAF